MYELLPGAGRYIFRRHGAHVARAQDQSQPAPEQLAGQQSQHRYGAAAHDGLKASAQPAHGVYGPAAAAVEIGETMLYRAFIKAVT